MNTSLRLLAAACAFLAAPFSTPATAAPSRPACILPAGWAEIAARHTSYILFGEIHGTSQSPAFVANLACALAARGERVLVGIEQEATGNDALQRAWALPDDRDFAAALRPIGWAGRLDGVASKAMFAMLLDLHALKSRGRAISVVAFNSARDAAQTRRFAALPGQGPHEAEQAENIRIAAEAGRYDHVLILVGNLHARKRPIDDETPHFEPMAMRLAPLADITSLNMWSAGGTMWNCLLKPDARIEPGKPILSDAIDCGDHPTGRGPADLGPNALMRLGPFPGAAADPSYDGFYWLGRVTGSPPAVPKR